MAKPGVNVYDIRKECVGPLCYDFSDADTYLNSAGERRGCLCVLSGGGRWMVNAPSKPGLLTIRGTNVD
jgi:hypothetical protein